MGTSLTEQMFSQKKESSLTNQVDFSKVADEPIKEGGLSSALFGRKTTFDPEGEGYDMDTAKSIGLKPDSSGHWPSRDPNSGMLLKGRKHPTWESTVSGEEKVGNEIYQKDGRWYSKSKPKSTEDDTRRYFTSKGIYPFALHPAMTADMARRGYGPQPTGGFDELGRPIDKATGEPYYVEGGNVEKGKTSAFGNEEMISEEKSKPSYISRALNSLRDLVGTETNSKISEAAKAQSVVKILADEAGVPLSQYRVAPELIEQAASAFTGSVTMGLIPAIRRAAMNEEDFEATSTAGHIGHAVGSLGGLMLGPFKIAGALTTRIPKASADMRVAERIFKSTLHESITMGLGMGIASTGEALENVTFTQAAKTISKATASGAAVGSIFGAVKGLFPEEGVQAGVRMATGLIGLNAYRAAEIGGNPFTDRPLGDVAFDILLDAAFLYRGLPKSRVPEVVKDLKEFNTDYEKLKQATEIAKEAPPDVQAQIDQKVIEVQKTLLRNKYEQFVKKIGGDVELLNEYSMQAENVAKSHIRPIEAARPEMAEDYKAKPVKLNKKEQAKLDKQKAAEKSKDVEVKESKVEVKETPAEPKVGDPLTVEMLQVDVDTIPELKGKVLVDALGEEGTTTPPGYAQITIIGDHPASGGSFTVEANPSAIIKKLNVEREKWTKPDESVKKFNKLETDEDVMTPQQLRALNSMVEDIESSQSEVIKEKRPPKRSKVIEDKKPIDEEIDYFGGKKKSEDPINEIDKSTGNSVPSDVSNNTFMRTLSEALELDKIFAERENSVRSDPEIALQKAINDVRLWVHGKDIDIKSVRRGLSELSSRSGELREFFSNGADHLQFVEVSKEAAKWARNTSRSKGIGTNRFNLMVPVDQIPETVKAAFKYMFPGKPRVKASEIVRSVPLWKSTGFWIARDGMWRYEIDGEQSKFHPPKHVRDTYTATGKSWDMLGNILTNEKLYETIPEAKSIMVKFDKNHETKGTYNADENSITIKGLFDRDTLEHEVQHLINRKLKSSFTGSNTDYEASKQLIKTLEGLHTIESEPNLKKHISDVISELKDKNSVNIKMIDRISPSINKVWGSRDAFVKDLVTKGFEAYRKDPGEMEARLAEYRSRKLTKEERTAEPPWVSLDKMLEKEGRSASAGLSLYSGDPSIEAAGKAIIAGARRVADYTAKARGMKKFKLGEAFQRTRQEFVRSFIDRSGNIKGDLVSELGEDGYKIVQKMVLAKGASSRSAKELKQMRAEVYEGLSGREKKILDDIILDDRMIDIAKYKSEGEFKFPADVSVRDFVTHRALFGQLEKLTSKQVEKLNSRAEAYFEWMKKPLEEMLESGLISKDEYDNLVSHNYRRIKLVDIFDKRHTTKIGKKNITVFDSGVEALSRGRDTDVYEPSSEVMALEVFNRAHGRILKNEANKALYELAERDPENPFVRVKINKEDKIPSGWHRLNVFEGGEKKSMWVSPEMGKEWIVNSPEISYKLGQILRYASGSPVLRTFATGINWGFAVANIPRDIMHAWFTARRFEDGKWKSLYSQHTPVFASQMGRDLGSVFTDAALRKGRYNEYIDEGGGMEFLVHQGRLLQRGRHLDSSVGKILDFMGYLGETGEILTRLAIRDRVIRKEAQKRGISMEEARKDKSLREEATFAARDYMDFGQGGGVSKAVDNALPYLNASIQGTRGMFRAFKPGSGMALESTYKLAQFAAVVTGTYIASNALAPLTSQALKGNIDKENNLVIPLGDEFSFVDEKGETRYIYFKIPIDPGQKFFKTVFEGATDKWLGNEVDVDGISRTLKDQSPIDATQLPPTMSAVLGYISNKDFWLNEDIWKGTDKPFSYPKSKEEFTKLTPQAYVDIGKATGLSPERTKYAVEEMITNGTIWSYLLNQGYDAAFGGMEKEKKEQHIAQALAKFPGFKRFIGITNPYSKHADKIENAAEGAVIDRFVQNRNMDILIEGHIYGKVPREEMISYARSFKDADTYDRLIDRYKWEKAIQELPEKSFWKRMKGLPNEAKAEIFVERLNSSNPIQQKQLWKELSMVSRAGDVISDDMMSLVSKKRFQLTPVN